MSNTKNTEAIDNLVHYETKLYTNLPGVEFVVPFSLDETKKMIKESEGKITVKKYQISNRVIRDNLTNEQTLVDVNTEITTYIDTNITPIVIFEEYKMKDVLREKETQKKRKRNNK